MRLWRGRNRDGFAARERRGVSAQCDATTKKTEATRFRRVVILPRGLTALAKCERPRNRCRLCRVSAAKLASPKPKHHLRGCAAAIHLTVRHICRGEAGASEMRPYQGGATDLHPALSSPSATPLRSGGYATRLSEPTERRRAQRLRRKTRLVEGEARDEGASAELSDMRRRGSSDAR